MKTPGRPPIYKNLEEIIHPTHTVLVVWDVQNGLVNQIFNKEEFLPRTKQLIQACRKIGIPIFYTKITPLPRAFESPFRNFMMMKNLGLDDPDKLPAFMAVGSPAAEIHPEVAPQPEDVIFNKYMASIFIGTHFEYMLKNRGTETIIFTGINTEVGVESSARDAINRSFYTIVVEDCVSSSNKEMHDAALKVLRRQCLVIPSQDVLKLWP